MPDTKQSLERYALALALVPDETEAGDIFMAARDEEHLCRLAAQWRERHGLPHLANPPTLPTLTEEQAEYGLHVVRRRERRRRSRLVLAAVAVVCLLVGAAALGRVPLPATRPLDPARADGARPAQVAKAAAQPILEVTRAEATPGSVTVTWTYTGAQGDVPVLFLGDSTIMPDRVESRREGSGEWIEGTSTYTVITAGKRIGRLEFRKLNADAPLAASEPFDMTRVSDPSARVIERETVLYNYLRRPLGTIDQVVLGANYTLLRYRPTEAVAHADTLEVMADGRPLEAFGELAPMGHLTDGQVFVLGSVPPGTEAIEVKSTGSRSSGMVLSLQPKDADVQRIGPETLAVVALAAMADAPFAEATFLTIGEAYKADVRELERSNNMVRYELRSSRIPPGTEIIGIQLYANRQHPGPPATIDL